MKQLIVKIIIMVGLYSFCNYFIWFGLYQCIYNIREATYHDYLEVSLAILLFQPHIIILYNTKQCGKKKERFMFWCSSSILIFFTLMIWYFILF